MRREKVGNYRSGEEEGDEKGETLYMYTRLWMGL